MNEAIFKAGEQSAADPYEFVMSTDTVDRMGDVVVQDWKLAGFRKNAIALWNHNSGEPIGRWEKVRVEAGKLMGNLKLADPGTSDLIDTLRRLVEQRILKAVSVGFKPGKYEALDEDDPWGGLRLSNNELFECSLVSVPANAEALSVAKSLSTNRRKLVDQMFAESGASVLEHSPAAKQLGLESRDSDENRTSKPPLQRKSIMSLQDKIQAKREQLTVKRDALATLTETDVSGDESIEESVTHEITELSDVIKTLEGEIDSLETARAALAAKALDREPATKSTQDLTTPRFSGGVAKREKHFNAVAAVSCLLKAHISRASPYDVAKSMFKDDPQLETVIRAATAPADMTDAAWAGPLVQDTWSGFLELVRDTAVYPRLPGMRLEFDRYGKISIPKNVGRGNLAGGFIGEGAPIPVKEGVYGTTDLAPKKMAVISSFTREIAEHSMPAVQALVQNQMVEDTSELLDTLYLDATARSALRPAGMQDTTETGAGNIEASSGNTVANVLADTKAAIGRLLAARTGNGGVWVMNPLRVLGLRDMQDAASGEFVFRAELSNGMFRGYPVLESQNVTADIVILQSNAAVTYANDYAPRIAVSSETVLVYDDTAPDDILPDTNVMPAKSMFQIDAIAVRMTQGLDWRITRQGGVQVLTGVDW